MSTKVVTETEVRLSYTNLIAPRAQNPEKPDVLTYSTAILIPKGDTKTIDAIKAAINEAVAEGVTKKWGGKRPSNLRNPLRDGDEDRADDENYKGMFFINAKGPRGGAEQPILLDSRGAETKSQSDIYSGVNARVSLQFYAYDNSGNRGIACGVASVLSTGKGDPLTAQVTAESARGEFGVTTAAGSAAAEFAGSGSAAALADDPWS